jgi:hypothetical protein
VIVLSNPFSFFPDFIEIPWVHPNFAALTLNPVPLLPFWRKGLGDEGKLAKLEY